MDDSCAVCADSLEWVAYEACGHRDVCSTCAARLRFICNDRRCCICKTESNVIFVTKALGDYTWKINDFSVFPSQVREGRTGSYWYHEDTQAFFDDVDHYEVIKAMCRLSCNVCDQSQDGVKRLGNFRNIEHLKGHLFHMHRLAMCSLCLEGRRVFISEQKLYSRAQLNRHTNTGDSEVDGTESERGGFMGHPKCVFCRIPFYGDSELHSHMSTEHYTCHICQRLHPGQNKYYKKYDNLEARGLLCFFCFSFKVKWNSENCLPQIHFRQHHYLCEDEACLTKKFTVFRSVAELKRHNTIEHGGRMSRAQRNAALQLPTSFQYRSSNEDNHYRRGRMLQPQPYDTDHQLSMAIEASLRTANGPSASSSVQVVSTHGGDTHNIDQLVLPFELLSITVTNSESSSRYRRALGAGSSGAPFQESSFPPLPMVPENNTKEFHLRCQKNRKKKKSSSAQTSCRPMEASSSSSQNGKITTAAASSVVTGNASRISHSSSTSNLGNGGYLESEPSVSAAQRYKQSSSSRVLRIVEDVHTTNKSLAEKIELVDSYLQSWEIFFSIRIPKKMQDPRNSLSQLVRMETFLFTSESVNEGHPDKLCDQISDAVLDACLAQDPDSKVACETCTKTNMVMVFGEITTKANVDYEKIVRDTCRSIGFVSDDVGLDADNCKVLVNIEQQSPDIAQGVHGHFTKRPEEIGAGDQGHMFGYATDETPELMPLSHVLATKLGARLTEVRKNGTCPWLRPDGKTQVTVEYYNDKGAMVPVRVHTVLISTQHDETVTNDEIAADLKEHVIKPVIPEKYLDEKTIFHLNPSGRFVIGGPHGDAGLTGRKIIIDTYGGWGAHGGGAFSGKDPTKVDRSGAYIVRQAAKSIVANGLARRCIVQVSYAIGVPEPLSVFVDSYGTGKIPDKEILQIVKENFDFRPGMITINLDLKRGGNGRFLKTAAYGHFGRDDPDFTWEVVKPLKWEKPQS
ncbi:hypothetical protein V6N13_131947 [Hibiscus sabdariffa]